MATPPVPNRHAKQTRFLAALTQGRSPAEGAALAGVPLPTFYTWRTKHTRFREAWDKAVAYAQTPPFPSPAQLAAVNLTGPKTHWGWVPGGMPVDRPREPGDRIAMILQTFDDECPDTLIYYTVQPDGDWKEDCRGTSNDPLPEGIEPPDFLLADPRLERRLPPGCRLGKNPEIPARSSGFSRGTPDD